MSKERPDLEKKQQPKLNETLYWTEHRVCQTRINNTSKSKYVTTLMSLFAKLFVTVCVRES